MTRPATSVQKSLALAASAAVSSPVACSSSARSTRVWAASTSVAHSARTNLVFWNAATGLPKT